MTVCPHMPACTACPRFGEPGIASGPHSALDDFARGHGLAPVPVISGALAGFRLRARLAIRGRVGSPKVGLFESGTHRVVHVPSCPIHHPLINRVAAVVRRAVAQTRVSSYSDKAHLGVARYLQVAVERASQTAQVVLVANSRSPEPVAECLELIRQRLSGELHSLWFNANRAQANTILGGDFERWCGPESIVESFGGAEIHYPPGAFGQNNLDMAQQIIAHVRALIPAGASVAEFYAGVGAIGLSVLPQVGELRMNEVAPSSLHGLELGLSRLDAPSRKKVSVLPGGAGAMAHTAAGVHVVIADPPRRGLEAALAQWLRKNPPQQFIYVSCALQSLLDDAARLTAPGGMRLDSLTAFNLMPYTEHVETVAHFVRSAGH